MEKEIRDWDKKILFHHGVDPDQQMGMDGILFFFY